MKKTAKEKIMKKLNHRFLKYDDKYLAAKTKRSEKLWHNRKYAAGTLISFAGELLDDKYSTRKCERILRELFNSIERSETDGAKAMAYVLDDVL